MRLQSSLYTSPVGMRSKRSPARPIEGRPTAVLLTSVRQLYFLSHGALQAALLRNPDQPQVCDAHGHSNEQFACRPPSDIRGTLRRIRCVMADPARGMLILTIAVVKNPLSPVEHPGGMGVNCEMFELGLDQFSKRLFPSIPFAGGYTPMESVQGIVP